jgi:hypothetical protein
MRTLNYIRLQQGHIRSRKSLMLSYIKTYLKESEDTFKKCTGRSLKRSPSKNFSFRFPFLLPSSRYYVIGHVPIWRPYLWSTFHGWPAVHCRGRDWIHLAWYQDGLRLGWWGLTSTATPMPCPGIADPTLLIVHKQKINLS